jgi:hypothetical protein
LPSPSKALVAAEMAYVHEDILSVSEGHPFFRLLTLAPNVAQDSPISCTLAVNSFSNGPPKYEALSYCWGEIDDLVPMTCDGAEIRITRNLDTALRRLRRLHEPRVLWIDAICINQASIGMIQRIPTSRLG